MSNVISVDFVQQKKAKFKVKKFKKRGEKPSGVFIKPCGVEESLFMVGNIGGFIGSWLAFNPSFSPSLFCKQIKEEYGVANTTDNPPALA